MTAKDTIFALSSGAGRAAVAVIRISGPVTSVVLESLTGSLPPARRLAPRAIRHPKGGEVMDKGMAVWLPGPRSFTGEDCAELHLHGSAAVVSGVLEALSGWPGVRPAEPGEFTRRAFLNGKMDLVEVEGLADLLQARTAGQRRRALRQVFRESSSVFESWRRQLLEIRASIEAVVDFVDEPGVAEEAAPAIDEDTRALLVAMQRELDHSKGSEILRDGVRVVLAGYPNTGKSSLLNSLACREAAIVSDVPGTTRDAIEVTLDFDGVPAIITDTAGLRFSLDKVEEEGIRRSRQHISLADVVVWVWSSDIEDSEMPPDSILPDLLVENKCDIAVLIHPRNDGASIRVSTRNGEGLPRFVSTLSNLLRDRFGGLESTVLTSARQKYVSERSIRFLNNALELGPAQLELKAENIRNACDEVARLTGRVDVEEWLGAIFSRFCIGK